MLKTAFENPFYVSMAVKDRDNLQGLCLWPVDDEIRIDREELHWLVRQTLVPVPGAWCPCQETDPVADDGFHAIGCCNATLPLDVTPDLDKIERGLRRE